MLFHDLLSTLTVIYIDTVEQYTTRDTMTSCLRKQNEVMIQGLFTNQYVMVAEAVLDKYNYQPTSKNS